MRCVFYPCYEYGLFMVCIETMSEDIATARDSIQNAREGIEKLRVEVAKIQDKCNDAEVRAQYCRSFSFD